MFNKFVKNKIINIYTKQFYLFSSVANIISSIFAFFIVPGIGHYFSIFGIVMFLVMLLEGIRKTFKKEQYNNRYTIKILYEILITSFACILMPQSYLMYLPILLSQVYMNVNTAIKSKILHYSSLVFMLIPLFKILTMQQQDILIYISVCSLFMMISLLSTFLFRSNQEMISDAENRTEILKEIFKLTNRHTVHDVRNELSSLYILSYKQYENPGDYMEIVKERSENIQRSVNTNIFDNEEEIDLELLMKDLDKYTRHYSINYCNSFIDRKEIISNRNFLYAILKNILENCISKSEQNNIVGDVVLIKRENMLMILDECGKTYSKDFERFLAVIQDPSVESIFQFTVRITELEKGYEYRIIFQK